MIKSKAILGMLNCIKVSKGKNNCSLTPLLNKENFHTFLGKGMLVSYVVREKNGIQRCGHDEAATETATESPFC